MKNQKCARFIRHREYGKNDIGCGPDADIADMHTFLQYNLLVRHLNKKVNRFRGKASVLGMHAFYKPPSLCWSTEKIVLGAAWARLFKKYIRFLIQSVFPCAREMMEGVPPPPPHPHQRVGAETYRCPSEKGETLDPDHSIL